MKSVVLLCICICILEAAVHKSSLQRSSLPRQRLRSIGKLKELSKSNPQRACVGSQHFIDYNDNFYQPISLSEHHVPQTFTIVPDTGSSDFWVVSAECNSDRCRGFSVPKHRYNKSASDTYKSDGSHFTTAYGSAYCEGYLGIDKLSFAGFTYPTQTFGIATTIPDVFGYQPIDGVMGLGWPALAANNVVPPVQNLLSQFPEPIFTVYMSRHIEPAKGSDGGVITYGGFDHDNCDYARLNWVPLTSETYWQFTLNGFSIDRFSTSTRYQVISDTGTSRLGIPKYILDKIVSTVGANYSLHEGEYLFDCSKLTQGGPPPLVFNIGGKQYTVPFMEYIIKLEDEKSEICVLGAFSVGSGGFAATWILGDVFIRSYCNVYDVQYKRIGFANPKHWLNFL